MDYYADPDPIDRIWITYRRADGEPIYDEYTWIDTPELLNDLLDPTEIIIETWVLQKVETYTTEPNPFAGEYDEEEE